MKVKGIRMKHNGYLPIIKLKFNDLRMVEKITNIRCDRFDMIFMSVMPALCFFPHYRMGGYRLKASNLYDSK